MSRQDIQTAEQRFLDAFNGGDASEAVRVYSEGARVLPPNSDIVQGRAAIEALLKDYIQMGASVSFDLVDVHESLDLCAAVGRYRLELHPQGADPKTDTGKFIEVWKRQADGSWLLTEDIWNSSLPAPGS